MQAVQNRSLLYESEPLAAAEVLPEADLVPPGLYPAKLSRVQLFSNAWGERVAFVFVITGQEQAGKVVIHSTSTNLSRLSKLGVTLSGLLGRKLAAYELEGGFDPAALEGASCRLVLGRATTRSGTPFTKVDSILL